MMMMMVMMMVLMVTMTMMTGDDNHDEADDDDDDDDDDDHDDYDHDDAHDDYEYCHFLVALARATPSTIMAMKKTPSLLSRVRGSRWPICGGAVSPWLPLSGPSPFSRQLRLPFSTAPPSPSACALG